MPTDISFYCKASVAPEKKLSVCLDGGGGGVKKEERERPRERVQWEE